MLPLTGGAVHGACGNADDDDGNVNMDDDEGAERELDRLELWLNSRCICGSLSAWVSIAWCCVSGAALVTPLRGNADTLRQAMLRVPRNKPRGRKDTLARLCSSKIVCAFHVDR